MKQLQLNCHQAFQRKECKSESQDTVASELRGNSYQPQYLKNFHSSVGNCNAASVNEHQRHNT